MNARPSLVLAAWLLSGLGALSGCQTSGGGAGAAPAAPAAAAAPAPAAASVPAATPSFGQRLLGALAAGARADGATATAGGAGAAAKPAAAVNPLAGTELDGLFKKFAISNSNKPERWPRVAITVKSVTPGVHTIQGQGTLRDTDCMSFDIRLWRSATENKRFDNLQLCTPAVASLSKGVAYRTLDLFPQFTAPRGENTTASRRSDGPQQPFYMFPQDIKSQQQWILGPWNNKFFLGALLVALGYNWDDDFDRRLWVVSVPLPP